ncbi:DNA-binding transcriptional LysR family regulator [Streptomyces filamentosus]
MCMTTDVRGRGLRHFFAVAEELHFTRAAERPYVSRPTLSKQIRALERQLGAPPFDRGRQGVRLTEAGTTLLPYARAVLAAWGEAEGVVRAARGRRTAPRPSG